MFEQLEKAKFDQLSKVEKQGILRNLASGYRMKMKNADEEILIDSMGNEFIFIPQSEKTKAMLMEMHLHEISFYPIRLDDPRIENYREELLQAEDDYFFDGVVRFMRIEGEWQASMVRFIDYGQFLQNVERDGFSLLNEMEWRYLAEMNVIERDQNEIIVGNRVSWNENGQFFLSALDDEALLTQQDGYRRVIQIDETLTMKKGALLTSDQLEVIQSCQETNTGYFGLMKGYLLEFIQTGIEEGRFNEDEALQDVEIALWYAYACNNLDVYEQYYDCCQWMQHSYQNARGCGVWYYRYSVALMYCGRVEEAYQFAKQGAKEDPTYPWIWLELAKLHNHFKQREQALSAVEKGLSLVPNDFEFLTLKKEIEKGYVLEQMEYHWIDPQQDQDLQEVEDKEKLQAISCILCDEEALKQIKEILNPLDWRKDCPYCSYHEKVGDHQVEMVFRMNEAGLSKKAAGWIEYWKNVATYEGNQMMENEEGLLCQLTSLLFDLNDDVTLIYYSKETDQYFHMCFTQKNQPNLN